ncbi:MAG: glycosyltransferase [Bacillota bacterium]
MAGGPHLPAPDAQNPPAPDAPRLLAPAAGAGPGAWQPPPLVYRGFFLNGSGYGEESRGLAQELIRRGYALRVDPVGPADPAALGPPELAFWQGLAAAPVDPARAVHIVAQPPGMAQRPAAAPWAVLRTMFETEVLPREWVQPMSRFDAVWVPSEQNRQAFVAAGLPGDRVRVVPGGVDPDRFRPGLAPLPLPMRRGFAFLSVFDWQYRKGWDCLVRAYARAFGPADDVVLYLKVTTSNKPVSPEAELAWYLRAEGIAPERMPPLVLLTRPLPAAEMPRLYASADAFVLPSRGEGYARPYLEAMASGLPVIGTAWGGQADFLTPETGYPLRIQGIRPVPRYEPLEVYRGLRWAEPDADHLVDLLREVWNNREAARQRGRRARQQVVERWSVAAAADRLEAALRDLVEESGEYGRSGREG